MQYDPWLLACGPVIAALLWISFRAARPETIGFCLLIFVTLALAAWGMSAIGEPAQEVERARFDCEAYGGVYERHWGKGREEPDHSHRACMIGSRHLWTDSSAGRMYAKGVAIPPVL